MSVYTRGIVKRAADAVTNPQGIVDKLVLAAASQAVMLSFYGAGQVLPFVDDFRHELEDEMTTRLGTEYLATLSPWSV